MSKQSQFTDEEYKALASSWIPTTAFFCGLNYHTGYQLAIDFIIA